MPRPWLPMSAGCGAWRSATSRRTRPTRTGSCWRRPCFSFPRARCRFVANRADKTCYISLKNPRVGYSAAMAEVLLVLLLAIEIAFAVLAIRTVAAWIHQPDRRHGNLAIAIGSLAVVMLLAPSLTGTGANTQLLTDLAAVIFLVSGYGLLMFRDSFVPFGVAKTRLVTLLIVAVGLLDIAVQLPADPESPHNAVQSLALVSTVGVWAFCILEPIVRSSGRNASSAGKLPLCSTQTDRCWRHVASALTMPPRLANGSPISVSTAGATAMRHGAQAEALWSRWSCVRAAVQWSSSP